MPKYGRTEVPAEVVEGQAVIHAAPKEARTCVRVACGEGFLVEKRKVKAYCSRGCATKDWHADPSYAARRANVGRKRRSRRAS
jgi:hypothetical protein